jgi:hypothetical protein
MRFFPKVLVLIITCNENHQALSSLVFFFGKLCKRLRFQSFKKQFNIYLTASLFKGTIYLVPLFLKKYYSFLLWYKNQM